MKASKTADGGVGGLSASLEHATISGPSNVVRALHVGYDKATGTFSGVPSAWRSAMSSGASAGSAAASVVPTPPPGAAPGGLRAGKSAAAAAAVASAAPAKEVTISGPVNVRHEMHVRVDASAPSGLAGLPPQWDALLSASGITREQVASHPQEVLDVLQFHMEGPPPALPKKTSLAADMETAAFITPGDPVAIFSDLHKLGEGASGQVFLGTDARSREKVAIKVAPATELAALKQEIALQKMCAHPCVVGYKETFLAKDQLWVRMQLCQLRVRRALSIPSRSRSIS